ncbi:MAG: hypothetical protein LBG27_11470 [Spirochaetaceae bacterium]|jgi:hypothetical protein|nr:hypothetical protein [Spirochaetaceae bacterium]
MSDPLKNLNNLSWERLFSKYDILNQIDANGRFEISAKQIKEFREPRLMTKFDHTVNLPKIFLDNQLAILPITRRSYVISHFDAYHKFENDSAPVKRFSLPEYIQSLDSNNIFSETIALNCAVASGIVAEFLQDEALVSTTCGRMSSGSFDFTITNSKNNTPFRIQVNNSQIEIDAAYEGVRGLALFEAKRDLSNDFLVDRFITRLGHGKAALQSLSDRYFLSTQTVFIDYMNILFKTPTIIVRWPWLIKKIIRLKILLLKLPIFRRY